MSLLRSSWKNFAAGLFDSEVVEKLNEHQQVLDDGGALLNPSPDPHPQYFHLLNDTAWSGLHINASKLITLGSVIAPYDTNEPADWNMVSNLTAGTISIAQGNGGGFQLNYYFTFQVAANGGTYTFELYLDGTPSGNGIVVNLSNQSNVGNGSMCAFNLVNASVAPVVVDMRLDAGATRDVTILKASWSVVRLFPPVGTL
jgi:hypothetical protein